MDLIATSGNSKGVSQCDPDCYTGCKILVLTFIKYPRHSPLGSELKQQRLYLILNYFYPKSVCHFYKQHFKVFKVHLFH